jgi:hypothetical protein
MFPKQKLERIGIKSAVWYSLTISLTMACRNTSGAKKNTAKIVYDCCSSRTDTAEKQKGKIAVKEMCQVR